MPHPAPIPEDKPFAIACLTGGVATGKSTVAAFLNTFADTKGFDSDAAVHEIMAEPAWIERLAGVFGGDILDAAGGIDRPALREKVFADPARRAALESLLHPEVRRRGRVALEATRSGGTVRLFLAEVPLLYESGFDLPRDYEIVVATSPATQRARLRTNRGLDDEMAGRIMAAQWPIMEKVRRAHLVIWNEGSITCLKRQALCLRRRLGLSP